MNLIIILLVCIDDVDVFDNRNCDNVSDCHYENMCESSVQNESNNELHDQSTSDGKLNIYSMMNNNL